MFDAAQKTILQKLKMFFFWFKSSPQIWGNMENLKPAYWLFDFLGVCYDIIGGKGWFYLIFAQGWILYTFVYIPMRVHQRENNLDTKKEFDVEIFFRSISRPTGRIGRIPTHIWNQHAILRRMSYRTPQ